MSKKKADENTTLKFRSAEGETSDFSGWKGPETDEEISTMASTEHDTHLEEPPKSETCTILKRLIPCMILGVGTGLAMTPVFNHLVKKTDLFGDLHKNDYIFAISTINTCLVYSCASTGSMYHYLKKNSEQILDISSKHKTLIIAAKIGAGCSALVPLSLLWVVELQNQEVSGSHGFDAFMAWATFTTVPLLIYRTIESCKTVDKLYQQNTNIELNSAGAKMFVYSTTLFPAAGRFVAYSVAGYQLASAMGIDETVAIGLGVGIGGVVGATTSAVFEYQAVKSLFQPQTGGFTCGKIMAGICTAIESMWFSIPIVALGLTATENWNPILKSMLFTPLFVSNSILEATTMYDTEVDTQKSLAGYCSDVDS